MRGRVMVVCVALASTVGCSTSEDDATVSRRRCVALRDHVVDLRLLGTPTGDLAAHRKALSGALGEDFVERCGALSSDQIKCALAATDSMSAAACSSASLR